MFSIKFPEEVQYVVCNEENGAGRVESGYDPETETTNLCFPANCRFLNKKREREIYHDYDNEPEEYLVSFLKIIVELSLFCSAVLGVSAHIKVHEQSQNKLAYKNKVGPANGTSQVFTRSAFNATVMSLIKVILDNQ